MLILLVYWIPGTRNAMFPFVKIHFPSCNRRSKSSGSEFFFCFFRKLRWRGNIIYCDPARNRKRPKKEQIWIPKGKVDNRTYIDSEKNHRRCPIKEPFEINTAVLQGDILAHFLFIISLYVLRTSVDLHKNLGLTLSQAQSRRHLAVKITDADYADDLALFADKIGDVEKLLHSLEAAAAEISLHVIAEFMCYNQDGLITCAQPRITHH